MHRIFIPPHYLENALWPTLASLSVCLFWVGHILRARCVSQVCSVKITGAGLGRMLLPSWSIQRNVSACLTSLVCTMFVCVYVCVTAFFLTRGVADFSSPFDLSAICILHTESCLKHSFRKIHAASHSRMIKVLFMSFIYFGGKINENWTNYLSCVWTHKTVLTRKVKPLCLSRYLP